MTRLEKLIQEILLEKKEKRDRCLRIADRKYDKPSAYKSGAVVKCRKGMIWKGLKEGKQVGTIYHFTNTGNLISILKDNILKASDQWATNDNLRPFNSFTRNKNGWDVSGFPPDVRITIDGDKLSNKYKIQPFNMDFGVDEMEERIYKDIPNIKDYILDITILDSEYSNWEIHKDILNSLYPNINLIKNLKETDNPQSGKSSPYGSGYAKLKEIILEIIQEDESLYKWFKRKGTPGKEGGWVDCNAPIRKDGKITGYKSCGREKGEKRSKYPSCRPTAAKCKDPGKGKKWGKTK
jgi:hypothetical protein